MGYVPGWYVLLSTLAVIFEFIGYRLFITLVEDNKIFMEINNDESIQQLIEENNTNPNINISMGTPNYSYDQNINTDTPTPYKDDYNFDERFANIRRRK